MQQSKSDGGTAFPAKHYPPYLDQPVTSGGMTLRQYAAIKLRVPDSGTDWLDKMIRKSNRDEFAAKALQGMAANDPLMKLIRTWAGVGDEQTDRGTNEHERCVRYLASYTYELADAMLAERNRDPDTPS